VGEAHSIIEKKKKKAQKRRVWIALRSDWGEIMVHAGSAGEKEEDPPINVVELYHITSATAIKVTAACHLELTGCLR